MIRRGCYSLVFIFILLPLMAQSAEEGRLLRYPDIYKDQVVFMYGGDLWTSGLNDGIARKLTSHDGLEILPKYSPDGQHIAFTGQYDGYDNVYVIPAEGGEPVQLTYLQPPAHLSDRSGPENMLLDWYPDGKRLLFMSRRQTYHTWFGHFYSVSTEGGTPQRLPLPKGGLTSFNRDGSQIAYNRKFRNFRTWKRYTGGLAQDIWIYNFSQDTTVRVTDWVGTDTEPVWISEKIYFTSDRPSGENPDQTAPGRANIWEYDLTSREFTQRTFFSEYDVKWTGGDQEHLIFENGGYLYTLDITSTDSQPEKLEITMPGDRTLARPQWEKTDKFVSTFNVAPTGQRAVFEARGDIYTVPKEHGDVRNLTQTPGIREKYPVWSPDGKWIAYYSDRYGEDDLYLIQDNMGAEEIRVTTNASVFRYSPLWSPDSKKLAFSDKSFQLWYVNIDDQTPVRVDKSEHWEIRDYKWSPDSEWLTYSNNGANNFSSIYVYNLDSEEIHQITSEMTNDWNPVFDPAGKFLYFLSDRHFNPSLGSFDFTYNYHRTAGVFLLTLQKDVKNPFALRSDEVEPSDDEQTDDAANTPPVEVEIDFGQMDSRMIPLPIDPDNYRSLHTARDAVFYITYPTGGLAGKVEPVLSKLHGFDISERKDVTIAEPVGNYDISPDQKHLIYQSKGSYYIIEAKPKKSGDTKSLSLNGMEAKVDYRAEWREIFEEAWRYQRDYFYNPNMNNVDWEAMRGKYAVLLPYVSHRYDLTYIIGEMIGELSNSHTYVNGGDYPDLDHVEYGLLGVDLKVENGFYKITKIYQGDNTRKSRESPLAKPGVNVPVGSYIIAIDGEAVMGEDNFNAALENKVNKQVKLLVNDAPRTKGAWEVTVKPLQSEFDLRHWDWIASNREKVSRLSNGKIGYIYLTDMSTTGLNEFVEQYYPQIRKQGLIIDVRYNGGGFVDELILERLLRTLVGMSMNRNGFQATVPSQVFSGYLACIINGYSASDGDIFPYYFKKYKLGPVIGQRTWGGVRGIRGNPGIMDGGYIRPPEFSRYDLDSTWNMENYGVTPTIEVDNRPDLVVQGNDPQLEKAVEVLLEKIRENPEEKYLELPGRPDFDKPYPEEYYEMLNKQQSEADK